MHFVLYPGQRPYYLFSFNSNSTLRICIFGFNFLPPDCRDALTVVRRFSRFFRLFVIFRLAAGIVRSRLTVGDDGVKTEASESVE